MRSAGIVVAAVAAAVAIAAPAPASVAPAVRYVAPGGADTGTCTSSASPCATISYAVDQAATGDTVDLAAGTYDQSDDIGKALTIRGPYAGVDARGRTPSTPGQAVIAPSGSYGLQLLREAISIDGLAFTGDTPLLLTRTVGAVVRNSLFYDADPGLRIDEDAQTTISHNQFTNTTTGIQGGYGGSDITIEDNATTGTQNGAISLFGYSDATVRRNRSKNDLVGIVMASSANAAIRENTITESRSGTDPTSSAVLLAGLDGAAIADNEISGDPNGVWVASFPGFGASSAVQITGNSIRATPSAIRFDNGSTTDSPQIHGNRLVGNGTGITSASAVALDATDNWWGCNAGPGQPGCDTITGSGAVDADPWLVLTAIASPGAIAPSGTATITASLSTNSAGSLASFPAPDGTPVRFTSAFGTLAPSSNALADGMATSAFTDTLGPGAARAWARVDNQKTGADVAVTGPKLGLPAFDFGTVANGSSSRLQKFRIHVYGGAPVTFGTAAITGASPSDFSMPAALDTCSGRTIPAGSGCEVRVRFAPAPPATGGRTATLSLPVPANSSALTAALSGTAAGFAIGPNGFGWGTIQPNHVSPKQKLTIVNYGSAPLVLGQLAIAGTDAAQFHIAAGTDSCSNRTIAPGTGCSLKLYFRPASSGAKSAQLTVPNNLTDPAATAPLSGMGAGGGLGSGPAAA